MHAMNSTRFVTKTRFAVARTAIQAALDFHQILINSTSDKVLQRLHYPQEVMLLKTSVFIGIGSDCYFDHTIRVLSQNYPHQRDPLTSQGARRRGLWVGLSHHVHLQQGPPLNHSRPTHCRQVQRAVGTKGDQLR